MKQKRIAAFVLSCVICTSALAGCSNSNASGGSSSQNSSTSSESSAAEPETTDSTQPEATAEADDSSDNSGALMIAEQGIFSAGGITVTSDGEFDPENQWEETGAGQTAHVDHANVLYQIHAEETGLPMVFLHGYGQSRMGWMTTPDGARAGRICSLERDTAFTLSMSRAAVKPERLPSAAISAPRRLTSSGTRSSE